MAEVSEYLKNEREQEWRVSLRGEMKNKERTQIQRVSMSEQDPDKRNRDFTEVNCGLSEEEARMEAKRCLDCVNPTCITGCPVNINIPKFIKKIEEGDMLESARVLKETNTLPAVCGRVCPQEVQCEQTCFYTQKLNKPAVAIGHLERFAADFEQNSGEMSVPEITKKNGIKVATIGSGGVTMNSLCSMVGV